MIRTLITAILHHCALAFLEKKSSQRLFELRHEISQSTFIQNKHELRKNLEGGHWIAKLGYTSDIFENINELNFG